MNVAQILERKSRFLGKAALGMTNGDRARYAAVGARQDQAQPLCGVNKSGCATD